MLSIFIRYFSIIYCNIYSYTKILRFESNNKSNRFVYIFISLIFSTCISSLPLDSFSLRIIFIYTACYVFLILYTKTKFHIAFTTNILSFAMSYITLSTASLITGLFFTLLQINTASIHEIYYVLSTSIIQCILVHFLFRIKRLKNGMSFLIKGKIPYLAVFFCILLIGGIIVIHIIDITHFFTRLFIMFTMILLALALLIWWRRKITQSYVEKLRVSEVEALYKEISDKEHEIEKLHSNNRYLARIIHKDNKLIPAMELAVRNYLQNGMQMKPEDARQYGIDLLAQLQTMAADREGIIQNYHDDYRFRPQIGLYSVDAIIYYMERRAIPHSIRYEYQFDKGLKEVMLSYIDENDAIHLLSDAIENSIIATMHAIKKEIKIHIGFIQDILFMDISDTGLPFEPATYQNFGLLQHTTHKDSGGSGVGLLDIWKLKHKYKISLQIYEYPPDDHEYTKKIRFFFDRRNHFLIQSYRSQEITSLITRSDLHVFPYVEGSDFILTLDEEINEEAE